MGLQPEPLRLQGQRPAAREGVVEGGEAVRVEPLRRARMVCVGDAGSAPALPDLLPRPRQHLLVVDVLPLDELLDDPEQPLALLRLGLLRGEPVRVRRGVVHHLREDDRPRRRQRPPRPPQVQGARMPVPDGLLAHAGGVDRVQRQGGLDQLLAGLHIRFHAVRSLSGGSTASGISAGGRSLRKPALARRRRAHGPDLMPRPAASSSPQFRNGRGVRRSVTAATAGTRLAGRRRNVPRIGRPAWRVRRPSLARCLRRIRYRPGSV